MKKINISTNKYPDMFAMVDDADYGWLNQWKWFTIKRNRTYYAARFVGKRDNQRMIRMHCLILVAQDGQEIDHANGNGLDNQRNNLRLCSHSQNCANRKKQQGTTSGFKGVCWSKHCKKWQAYITHDGKMIGLGYFTNEIEAAEAYDIAAIKYFGEFARLNFSEDCSSRESLEDLESLSAGILLTYF